MRVQRPLAMLWMAKTPQRHPLAQLQSLAVFLAFRQALLHHLARM